MIDQEWQRRERARALAELPPRASNYGTAVAFGDESTEDAHHQRCTELRRVQRVEFAVAPQHVVKLPDGSLLREGAEVTSLMFVEAPISGHEIVSYFVRVGIVLESLIYVPPDSGPQAA